MVSAKVREGKRKSSREFWSIKQTVLVLVDIYTTSTHSIRLAMALWEDTLLL